MSTDGLTPPGSATYDSGTMFVGDGTWDANDNTFLLPNLQGLNYATTRYNGMGNRFKNFPGYYNMVVAHGVLAAITFLFLVPIAIMVNRFYWKSYYWKLRIHIWAQILTVLLSTVVIILGFFQVGPRRSLTNPHHQIGLALYILILVQFIGGYLNYKRSKGRPHDRRFLRIVLHQWLGRVIGMLGVAQVALGLTLYGSPLSLFVLYAIAVFALVLAYFIFDFVNNTGMPDRYTGGQPSYVGGPSAPPPGRPEHKTGIFKWLLAGGALAAIFSRFKKKKDPGSYYGSDLSSEGPSHAPSGRQSHRPGGPHEQSYVTGDSYSEYTEKPAPKNHTWRNRLLGLGALGGIGYLLGRKTKQKQEAHSDVGSSYYYSDTSGGEALSRVEEGRPMTPATPSRPVGSAANTPNSQDRLTRPPPGRRQSYSDMSESSYMSGSPSKYKPRHPVRDGLFGLGAFGAAKGLFDWRKRRERKEQKRIEELRKQDAEDIMVQRRTSARRTGNGSRPSGRHSRTYSEGESIVPSLPAFGTGAAAAAGTAAAAAAASGTTPYPAAGGYPAGGSYTPSAPYPAASGVAPMTSGSILPQSTASLAPPPPVHGPETATYASTGSRPSTAGGPAQSFAGGSQANLAAAGAAGALGGAALGAAAAHDRRSRDNSRVRRSNEASPATPVSVKLNVHPDGRRVTLRRLTEEEAARERESKRTRNRDRRNRAESGGEGSMMSDIPPGPDPRFRRQNQGVSPSGAPRPNYAASSAAGSAAALATNYPAVPRPSSNVPPSSIASTAPYAAPAAHVPPHMHQPGAGPAGMSAASLQPPPSVSTLPGRRPSGAGLVSHPGSIASPGAYDNTTDTQASQMSQSNAFAEKRRRRRAQRAQASLAGQGDANRSVEFE